MSQSPIKRLYGELKQRSVFQAAAIYIVAAWGIAQVGDIVLPALGFDDKSNLLLLVLLGLGLPIALIGAWVFDLRPADESAPPRDQMESRLRALERTRRAAFAIIGMLMVGLAASLWKAGPVILPGEPTLPLPATDPANSSSPIIAVLPFDHLSAEPDKEYFTAGVSEDILNLLTHVEGLRVVSRSMGFRFHEPERNLSEIARHLNVSHLVSGSVRTSGGRVRITAELMDPYTGRSLWSNVYDRELRDIFQIQDEIANAVVTALKQTLKISLGEIHRERIPTANMDAYSLFLRAREVRNARRNRESMMEAIGLLEQAVEADPRMADAWGHLAYTLVATISWGADFDVKAYLERARQAAARALQLAPGHADALRALATAAKLENDFEEADQFFAQLPDMENSTDYARHQLDMGYLRRALELSARHMSDPLMVHWRPHLVAGLALISLDHPIEGAEQLELALEKGYDMKWVPMILARVALARGDTPTWTSTYHLVFSNEKLPYHVLLTHIKRLILSPPEERAAARQRFWSVASELGFNREQLLAAPGWIYLPVDFLMAVEEYERWSETFWTVGSKSWIWLPELQPWRRSESFRRRVRDSGMLAYWQKHGWPDLCRPLGNDDFACD